MKNRFSPKEVEAILDIPVRRLQFYLDIELVTIEGEGISRGRGVRRYFSANNIFELAVIDELKSTGVSLTKIKETIRNIRKNDPELLKLENYNEYLHDDFIEKDHPELFFLGKEKVSVIINFYYIARLVRKKIA